ncbi:MAG: response regulator [candidate division Zixibacteria bacterium]|nr:response regulator [candidate division Zixibacteria bacterium]
MNEPLILVAEDEKDIRELIIITLQISGFRVVGVINGQEALKKAVEIKPDLILMDVRMPKMTGFEACQILKKQEQTKNIPVVFLSAKGREGDIRTGLELGAAAYLVKPFTPEELPRCISQILAGNDKL